MTKKRSATIDEVDPVQMGSHQENNNKSVKMDENGVITSQSQGVDNVDLNDLEFEDAWEDEMEEDEDIVICNDDDDDDDIENVQLDANGNVIEGSGSKQSSSDQQEQQQKNEKQVYLPGQALAEGEVLDYDNRAYRLYHTLSAEWPCLSFDTVKDQFGDNRLQYPMSMYMVAGSQADAASNNRVYLMKVTRLHKTYSGKVVTGNNMNDSDNDDSDMDEDEVEEDPLLEYRSIKHHGGVNRIRCFQPSGQTDIVYAATWADTGKVHVWDMSPLKQSLDNVGSKPVNQSAAPLYTLKSHRMEGYAMDWCKAPTGDYVAKLLTGDCNGNIYLTQLDQQKGWYSSNKAYSSHKQSVEDLQWSPVQDTVFASASVDQTIQLWDTRAAGNKSQISIKAHDADVNVISWNRKMPNLLASGADDGQFRIWDLRQAKSGVASATYTWHKSPITSIEWSAHDESILAVSSADDQLTLWDFSVEADHEVMQESADLDIPFQLMFIHQGQKEIKELHWHSQIPGMVMSTASNGFDLFKAIVME
ncbi:hypothetical protein MIR68_009738 [Amoeboaphelidium protococcarum]|nr:hypothetical protein MIR68_009738 [Amoeboaphelidium protococcarum]